MEKPFILHLLTPAKNASPFDVNMAYDAGWSAVFPYTRVELDEVATLVQDARGQTAGIGVKFSSRSESTSLLNGRAIVDSAWSIYLPRHGGLFIGQSENYWRFLQEVAFPAWRSSARSWRGSWVGDVTAGAGTLIAPDVDEALAGLAPVSAADAFASAQFGSRESEHAIDGSNLNFIGDPGEEVVEDRALEDHLDVPTLTLGRHACPGVQLSYAVNLTAGGNE